MSAEPSPAPRASLNWRDLLVAIPILWGFDLGTGVILLIVLLLQGRKTWTDLNPALVAAITLASNLFAFAVMWRFACRKYSKGFVEAFALRYPGGRTLFSSVLIGAGAAVLGTLLNSRFGTGESAMGEMVSTETGAMWFIVLALTISPFEELYLPWFRISRLAGNHRRRLECGRGEHLVLPVARFPTGR